MSSVYVRIAGLAFLSLSIAGCGGPGGAPSSTPLVIPSTPVTFTIKGPTPTAVAALVGTGSFAIPSLSSSGATYSNGVVSLGVPEGTNNFAVAFVCPTNEVNVGGQYRQQNVLYVYQGTTLDGNSFTESCPAGADLSTTGTLTGSVDASAFPGASQLSIYAQSGAVVASESSTGPSSSFNLQAPEGTDTVAVVAYGSSGSSGGTSAVAAKLFPNQAVPGALNGGNPVVLSAADETTTQSITYSNTSQGFSAPNTQVEYEMGSGGGFVLANAATSQYPVVPSDVTQSGDSYSFYSTSYNLANSTEGVGVLQTASSASALKVEFPAQWSYAGPSASSTPVFYFTYPGFSGSTGVVDQVQLVWPPVGAAQNIIQVNGTANSMVNSLSLSIPNLSSLVGFFSPPAAGEGVLWTASISQGNFAALQALPADAAVSSVFNSGTFVVP